MSEIPPPVQDFGEYPRAAFAPLAPRIRFEAIGEAWRLFQAQMGTWVLAVFLFYMISLVCIAPFYVLAFMQLLGHREPRMEDILMMYAILIPGVFVAYVVQAISLAGLYNLAMKQVNGEEITIKDFFCTGGSVFSHIGASMLTYVGIVIGSIACYIPGLLVLALSMFVHPIIVHQKLGAIDALKMSWSILKPHMWTALGFILVVGILASLGGLACGIGALFTYPLLPLSVAIVYRDFAWAIHEGYDPNSPVVPYDIHRR